MSSFRFDFGASGAAPAAPGAQAAVDAAAAPPPQPPRGVSTRLEAVNASDPLQLFPGIPPTLLATLSAPSVLRAGVCCKRWREVTQRVVMRRTADGAGPASVSLLVKSEDCEEGSEVACALGALTRTLAWAPEVALIFATEDAACYSDGSGLRTLEEDVRARLPRACLVACGRAPGVFGPVAGAPQELADEGGCAVLLLRGARGAGPPGILAVPGRKRRADKVARGTCAAQAPRPAPPFPQDVAAAAAALEAAAAAPRLLDAVRREEVWIGVCFCVVGCRATPSRPESA